ncbi:Lrp/AsnC family transcriptional regulator [Candidatus Woesearchaeota archaeon]|jgi:DNA-binding Lrp family transcriptional regulator|nr:Lrp/AsnC family transcriptional regulator [Candidatus Woesearchaeota archaeon]MBT4368657.1 Lrp/AsnC family transcriptional regulator [Candidatus Woesearchaeota archaeon]MBT4712212.1 Lrp/AsnC family transcriptional regulator [Candidatus Woesearchaeota archaeon]MBT6638956.1 Lrp/AsnC family transcriptional regulator [Candidatus Woesearchaeota archaeon]MBT7134142.1 Lrp/AsnC family transcriptional regulator [Candidatus Woesearchaeota archaeon]
MNSKKELVLLSKLRNNSRQRLTTLSKETRIPVSTIFEMLKRTNKIVKNTCLLNFTELGYSIRATITLKVDAQQKNQVSEFLLKIPNLNSLYKINNGYDFMLEVVHKEMRDLELFLELLDSKFIIKEKNVYYVIDELLRESFLVEESNIDLFKL